MKDSEKPVKICHMVVLSHLTGVQRVMFDLIRPLDPERYERHVICHSEGPLTEELEKNGIQWHAVPSLVRPIRPWHDFRAFFHVRKLCKEHGFDIVHTHSSKTGLIGRIAARWTGVPIVLHHVHGFSFHEYSKPGVRLFFSQIEKFAAYFTDRIVFVNREEREMTVDNGWAPAEKCVTIYNGTDLDKFDARHHPELRQEIREKFKFAEGEVAILVCGRLDRQKQCMILPEIAAALNRRLPDAAWRILVAGTGELDEELKAKIAEFKMTERIQLLGWYSKPHELMAASDIKLLPSLWEGLPLTLIEAQASALPIVVSNIKGNREVATEETGYLCDPKNPQSYAAALAGLCADPDLRQKMSTAARIRAEAEFDLHQTFRKVAELYEKLLADRIEPGQS